MTSPNELLSQFLDRNEVELSTIYTCSINENTTPGKFDAPTDWLSQLDGIIQQPIQSTIEVAKEIHDDVFIKESSLFEEHFIEVNCSILDGYDVSIYRYQKFTNAFLFYGIQPGTRTEFTTSETYTGPDFVIANFPSVLGSDNIVSLAIDNTLLQILCTSSTVLFHESQIPVLFNIDALPPYLPQLGQTLRDQAIRKGYDLRHVDILHHPASLEQLLKIHAPQNLSVPPMFQRLLEVEFDFQINNMSKNIPDPFEAPTEDVVHWLIERDKLQSLYMIVGQWKPSVNEALLKLDNRFPLHRFAHLLPSSKLLAEAWRQDPTCWWGQSAALHELLSESTP